MSDARPPCRVEQAGEQQRLCLSGPWRLQRLAELEAALAGCGLGALAERPVCVDGSGLEALDTAAALLLLRALVGAGVAVEGIELAGFAASHQRILELVRARLDQAVAQPHPPQRRLIAQFGAGAVGVWNLVTGHLAFLGLTLVELARVLRRPSILRRRELLAQFKQVCVTAIPVIALVTFLIGAIVAYLLGMQAEKYGANIFVVDGVALGMVREFAPIIVATIIAGRSGAAFTAQLGTMKLTEEIDAIRTLGLSPEQVLLIPRVLALVVSLPLLVFVGDVAGIWGAMIVSNLMLDITPPTFIDRLHSALEVRHYVIGLGKAPVFALFIAVIGCRMGISVSRDTRSIGINTTSTVVQSIVVVILLDALFAVLFQEMDL